MINFLDVEASSLGPLGFPIEIGWAIVDDRKSTVSVESHLIRPAQVWLDSWEWDVASEKVHGLSLAQLERDGKPIDVVCARLIEQFNSGIVYSDCPSFDGRWLRVLFSAWEGANLPRDQLPIQIGDAYVLLGPPSISQEAFIYAEGKFSGLPIVHRAGEDSNRLAKVYLLARGYDLEHRKRMHQT